MQFNIDGLRDDEFSVLLQFPSMVSYDNQWRILRNMKNVHLLATT